MAVSSLIDAFYDKFWNWRLDNSPEFATALGIRGYDDRLDDLSLEQLDLKRSNLAEFAAETTKLEESIDQDESSNKLMDLKILKCEIEDFIYSMRFCSFLYPVNQLEGPQNTFPRLISWMKKETISDYDAIISRLQKFPNQMKQIIKLLTRGLETGFTMHSVSICGVPEQIEKLLLLKQEQSELFKPFLSFPDSFTDAQKDSIKIKGISAIEKGVIPAFRSLQCFIKEVYLEKTRSGIGASCLPNGKDYYTSCLKFHTTTSLPPGEIHQIGLKEVKRILGRVTQIQEKIGFSGDVTSFLAHLRSDKQFLFQNKEEILAVYKNVCKDIKKKMPNLFNIFPEKSFEILPVPDEFADSFPGAYYLAASIDGSRPGTFYVNTSFPEKRCKHEAVSLALHEAIPGHHHQVSLSLELEGEPKFKKYIEDNNYFACPARFGLASAFVEGWGLYSEYLGEEFGLYEDPYNLLGRLSHELLRASRLVVDTGMHMLGWSKEEAVTYMAQNTSTTENDIIAEIDRYITWPGQACAYKIGEITIRNLRSKAEKALEDKFDIKAFHNAVLMHGNIPLHVLEANIERLIKNTLAQ